MNKCKVKLLETVSVFIKHMDNERVEFSRKMLVYSYLGEPCEVWYRIHCPSSV